MSDDFCVEHGYEFMKSVMGNPVPYCTACDDEQGRMKTMAKEPWEKELDKHDGVPGREDLTRQVARMRATLERILTTHDISQIHEEARAALK